MNSIKATLTESTAATFIISVLSLNVQAQFDNSIIGSDVIFEEKSAFLAVEAEYFHEQSAASIRKWYRTSKNETPKQGLLDADGTHAAKTSNGAYLETLPGTRTTHGDEQIRGINFSSIAGEMAVLTYNVYINSPGKYYIWVRAYSTGAEDNGLHVGIDGMWRETGQRLQWCEGKNNWTWKSKQRTEEVNCGEAEKIFLQIDKPGNHKIHFSMREDGFEFDKWVLKKEYKKPEGNGPKVQVKSGSLPATYASVDSDPEFTSLMSEVASTMKNLKIMKAINFPTEATKYYKDKNKWMAINPNNAKEAISEKEFKFPSGSYDSIFLGVGENDGKSTYEVSINDKLIGKFICPLSKASFEEGGEYLELWENEAINKGDIIKVRAINGSADGKEYSRGGWSGIAFAPVTKGKDILEKLKGLTITETVGGETKVIRTTRSGEKIAKKQFTRPDLKVSDINERMPNGDGSVKITGELKRWHKVTLELDGPFAHELDIEPNPFRDYKMNVMFTHESGSPSYKIPAYFAADGNAGESSADKGIK
jgi:hypothetical protein